MPVARPAVDLTGDRRVATRRAAAIPGGALIETSHGPLRIEAVRSGAAGTFRLRAGPDATTDYGILDGEPTVDAGATVVVSDADVYISSGGALLTLGFDDEAPSFALGVDSTTVLSGPTDAHFTGVARYPLLSRVSHEDGSAGDGWMLGFDLRTHEPVYGLGERYAGIDARGTLIDGWNEDALGVNTGDSYKQVPFAWSPRGWGMFIHTPARVTHGVGYAPWSHRSYLARVDDASLDVFLMAGSSPAALLESYTGLTGRTPPLPEWALGPWMSRAYYRTSDETLRVAREIRERGMPCDVITLDGRAWLDTETRFGFDWDRSKIPDPRALTAALHGLGFRICAWEYPLISVKHPLHTHYAERGWLLKDSDGAEPYRYQFSPEPFGKVLTQLPESGIVDFTHPDAYADWRDRHSALFDDGIDFIKSDFGEQVPLDCVAYNGDTGARLHNAYTLRYNACVFEATAAAVAARGDASDAPFVFARAAYAGAQRYPIHWGGDPQGDWGGLAASLRGALSWGLSGGATYAHDIGGFYADRRDPELYVRWLQAAVFGSHLRFHGVGEREPWSYGDEVNDIAMRWLQVREALRPYLAEALREASANGLPVTRAMPLAFPDEPESWRFDTQFMCGDALLVAPVIEAGGRVEMWLPRGEWVNADSADIALGGRPVSLQLSLSQVPVWIRADAPEATLQRVLRAVGSA